MEKGSIKFSIQSWLLSLNSEPQKSRSASISDSAPPCMQNCRWGAKVIAATRLWVVRFANRGSRKGRQEQGTFIRRVKRVSGLEDLPPGSDKLPGGPLQDPGVESPRQQSSGAQTNSRAAGVCRVRIPAILRGLRGTPSASGLPTPSLRAATTGLTRSLGSLSCPRVAIQGKTRGSLQ